MHRRAQAAESALARVVSQNDHERLWKTVNDLRLWRLRDNAGYTLWKDRYRTIADLLPRVVVRWALDRKWHQERRERRRALQHKRSDSGNASRGDDNG